MANEKTRSLPAQFYKGGYIDVADLHNNTKANLLGVLYEDY